MPVAKTGFVTVSMARAWLLRGLLGLLLLSVSGQELTVCHTDISLSIGEGLCKGRTVNMNLCGTNSLSTQQQLNLLMNDATVSDNLELTETQCETYAESINTILKAGCKAMGSNLPSANEYECNSDEFCDYMEAVMKNSPNSCAKDSDCPVVPTEYVHLPCCDWFENALESRCAKTDVKKLDTYIGKLETESKVCSKTGCHKLSAGISLRTSHIGVYLAAVVVVLVGATV